MKHPVANITIEGQGWNPYAIAAEGKDAFTKRVIEDGHYLKNEDGIGYTDDQRKELAGKVFEKSAAFVEKHTKKAEPETAKTDTKKPDGKKPE